MSSVENVLPLTDGVEGLRVLNVLSAASLSETKNEAVTIGGNSMSKIHEHAFVHESSYVDDNVVYRSWD